MKTAYVADLVPEQVVTSFFVVHEKEIRATREGRHYLRLELGDRTGTVEARMWTGFEDAVAGFSRDDFVKVQARVEIYRNRPQLMVDRVRRAELNEVDFADFFPHTSANVDELWARLRAHAEGVRNPWLHQLLASVLDDAEISGRYRRAPAAKTMHHAYLGGLLEHVVSLCDLCRAVAGHYPEADPDLLITGAALHDVAKIYELTYDRGLGYSNEGQLLGHIVMAVEMVGKKADAIPGFPLELATLVKHMILSHHGEYEFGSPKLPMFREAVMLHYLDDLDSKMGAIRSALGSERGEQEWTDRSGALDRRLLRVERYVSVAAPAETIVASETVEQLSLIPAAELSNPNSGAVKPRDNAADPANPSDVAANSGQSGAPKSGPARRSA
jgi:3'-5' exoribonuclease